MKKVALSFALAISLAIVSGGCASSHYFRQAGVTDWTVAQTLHRSLDRWVGWKSMYAEFKLTVSAGDTTATARGHLIYLMGEKIEFGFRKPWNKFIGTFYILPDRSLYWGTSAVPTVYGLTDRIELDKLLLFPFANWDPRDIIPLPISGRTAGLQPDSVWSSGKDSVVRAISAGVTYWLGVNTETGVIDAEEIQRVERDVIHKQYKKFTEIDGWAIPTRVLCSDASGHYRIEWQLKDIDLVAQPYRLTETIDTFAPPEPTP